MVLLLVVDRTERVTFGRTGTRRAVLILASALSEPGWLSTISCKSRRGRRFLRDLHHTKCCRAADPLVAGAYVGVLESVAIILGIAMLQFGQQKATQTGRSWRQSLRKHPQVLNRCCVRLSHRRRNKISAVAASSFDAVGLQPCSFCQVDAEAISPPELTPDHFGRSTTELLVDITPVDLG